MPKLNVRGPRSALVSSWYPNALSRFDTITASSDGKALELIQALTVILPVSCSGEGLPTSTKPLIPSKTTAFPFLPVVHEAPLVSVPLNPSPDESDAELPDDSLNLQ